MVRVRRRKGKKGDTTATTTCPRLMDYSSGESCICHPLLGWDGRYHRSIHPWKKRIKRPSIRRQATYLFPGWIFATKVKVYSYFLVIFLCKKNEILPAHRQHDFADQSAFLIQAIFFPISGLYRGYQLHMCNGCNGRILLDNMMRERVGVQKRRGRSQRLHLIA